MTRSRASAWAVTLAIGQRGERVLDAVFGLEYLIVPATPDHQSQGLDRFWIHRRDGRQVLRVDYKCDVQAGRTGNLALEHVSVERAGHREAPGWVHTTPAEAIVVYVPGLDTAFVLEVAALRTAWTDILRAFPPRPTATAARRPYQSRCCCVPIAWLRGASLITRTVEAVAGQLSLPFAS